MLTGSATHVSAPSVSLCVFCLSLWDRVRWRGGDIFREILQRKLGISRPIINANANPKERGNVTSQGGNERGNVTSHTGFKEGRRFLLRRPFFSLVHFSIRCSIGRHLLPGFSPFPLLQFTVNERTLSINKFKPRTRIGKVSAIWRYARLKQGLRTRLSNSRQDSIL